MRIDIEQLKAVSRSVKREAVDVNDSYTQIMNIGNDIESFWRGEAAMLYMDDYRRVAQNIKQISNRLDRLSAIMQNIAEETEERERQLRQAFGNGGSGW